jgi:hypothetical protein
MKLEGDDVMEDAEKGSSPSLSCPELWRILGDGGDGEVEFTGRLYDFSRDAGIKPPEDPTKDDPEKPYDAQASHQDRQERLKDVRNLYEEGRIAREKDQISLIRTDLIRPKKYLMWQPLPSGKLARYSDGRTIYHRGQSDVRKDWFEAAMERIPPVVDDVSSISDVSFVADDPCTAVTMEKRRLEKLRLKRQRLEVLRLSQQIWEEYSDQNRFLKDEYINPWQKFEAFEDQRAWGEPEEEENWGEYVNWNEEEENALHRC